MELAKELAAKLDADPSLHLHHALADLRVSPRRYYEWMREGEDDRDESDPVRVEFYNIVHAARMRQARSLVGKATDHADRGLEGPNGGAIPNGPGVSWYQWQLETRFPKEFPRGKRLEVTGAEGGPLKSETKTEHKVPLTKDGAEWIKRNILFDDDGETED